MPLDRVRIERSRFEATLTGCVIEFVPTRSRDTRDASEHQRRRAAGEAGLQHRSLPPPSYHRFRSRVQRFTAYRSTVSSSDKATTFDSRTRLTPAVRSRVSFRLSHSTRLAQRRSIMSKLAIVSCTSDRSQGERSQLTGPTMLASTSQRYFPRSPQDAAALRREAAFRAQVSELREAMERLEQEQAIQFQRFAQIQQELDEIRRLLKKMIDAR